MTKQSAAAFMKYLDGCLGAAKLKGEVHEIHMSPIYYEMFHEAIMTVDKYKGLPLDSYKGIPVTPTINSAMQVMPHDQDKYSFDTFKYPSQYVKLPSKFKLPSDKPLGPLPTIEAVSTSWSDQEPEDEPLDTVF